MGGHDSDDLKIGQLVARRTGFSNLACVLEAQDFIDWIEPSVYITDGMYSPINAPIMAIAKRLPQNAAIVLDGANSFDGSYKVYDLVLSRIIPSKYLPIKQAISICPQPIIDALIKIEGPVLSKDFLATSTLFIKDTYKEFIDSIPSSQLNNPFDCIDFLEQSNRIRRFNMMGTVLLRAFCEVRQPFFDHRVIDFVTKLPPLYRTKEKFLMGRYLMKLDPLLASLTYERTGLPANANITRQIIEYTRRAAMKYLGFLHPAFKEKPRVAINYMYWIQNDSRLQKYIRNLLLDPGALKRSHVNGKEMEPFLEDLFKGKYLNLFLTTRLISMELWYRYFVENNSAPRFSKLISSMVNHTPVNTVNTLGRLQKSREA